MELALLSKRAAYVLPVLRSLTLKRVFNLLRCVVGYVFRLKTSGAVPPVVTTMLTYRCNLKCIMCQKSSIDPNEYHDPQTMDYDALRSFIEQYGDRILVLRLFGGEPLLHPRILEVLDMLNERRIAYTIGTNGILLDDAVVDRLSGKCGWVSISFDTADDERYAWIRDGGTLQELRDNLRRIQTMKTARHTRYPIVNGNATIFTYNLEDIEGLIHFCREFGVEGLSVSAGKLYNTPLVGDEHLIRNDPDRARRVLEEAKALAERLEFNLRVRMRSIYVGSRTDEQRTRDAARRKPGLYFEMTVQPDFTAVAAFEGYRPMGRLNGDIREVWNADDSQYARLRTMSPAPHAPTGA